MNNESNVTELRVEVIKTAINGMPQRWPDALASVELMAALIKKNIVEVKKTTISPTVARSKKKGLMPNGFRMAHRTLKCTPKFDPS